MEQNDLKNFLRHNLFCIWLMLAATIIVSCASDDDSESPSRKIYGTLREALGDVVIVDSVKMMETTDFKEQYTVYIHQLIDYLLFFLLKK